MSPKKKVETSAGDGGKAAAEKRAYFKQADFPQTVFGSCREHSFANAKTGIWL